MKRAHSDTAEDGELAHALNELGEACQRRYPALCGPPIPILCASTDFEACLAYRFASGALSVIRERGECASVRDDYWRDQLGHLQSRMVSEVAAQSRSLGEELQSAVMARSRAESERDLARAHAEHEVCASHAAALSGQASQLRMIHDADRSSWLSDRSALEKELATLREMVRCSEERCSEASSVARAEATSCHSAEFERCREARHLLERELAVERERVVSAVATCKSDMLLAHGQELREQSDRLERIHGEEIARLRDSASSLEKSNAELASRLPGGSQKQGEIGEAWVEDMLRCVDSRWMIERTRSAAREMDLHVHGRSCTPGFLDFACRVEVKHSGRVKTDPDLNKFERDIDVLIQQRAITAAALVNIGGTIDHHTSGEVTYRTRPDGLRIPILYLQKEGSSREVFVHAFRQLVCLQRDSCSQFRCSTSNGAELSRLADESRRLRGLLAAHGRSLDRRISSVTASIRGHQAELVELQKQKHQVQQALASSGAEESPVGIPEASFAAAAATSTEDAAIGIVDPPEEGVSTVTSSTVGDAAEQSVAAWKRFESSHNGRSPRSLEDLDTADSAAIRAGLGFRKTRDLVRAERRAARLSIQQLIG